MKVIAGTLKGHTFDAPKGHRAHPMSERNRNALFNTLGDISGLTVLDAYGGSGAVAIEAGSRGAIHVDVCENSGQVAQTIVSNIDKLNLHDAVQLHQANVTQFLATSKATYDIAIADPPFDGISLKHLVEIFTAVKPGGVMAVSHPSDYSLQDSQLWSSYITHNVYGAAQLTYFRK